VQPIDRLLIQESICRYFFALDALSDAEAIVACFTEDAVWSCYDYGCDTPSLRFDRRGDLTEVLRFQAAAAGGVMLRHHLTGLVFDALDASTAQTRAKVLVTAQRATDPAPMVRNTAICEGGWRKVGDAWRISRWSIRRGPARSDDAR
jgi:hypothetical protein